MFTDSKEPITPVSSGCDSSLLHTPPEATPAESTRTDDVEVSWHALLKIAAFFCGGLIITIGHHCFYLTLNGKAVPSTSQQEWMLRFGNAMATFSIFLFRSAIAASYSHVVWHVCRTKPLRIRDIDSMFSLCEDPRSFFRRELFKDAPGLVVIAMLTWLLPLTALAPPGTLSVTVSPSEHTLQLLAPSLVYPDLTGSGTSATQAGELDLLLDRTATSMAVLPIGASETNITYEMSFYGPALQCHSANVSEQEMFDLYWQASADSSMQSANASDSSILTAKTIGGKSPTESDPLHLLAVAIGSNADFNNLTTEHPSGTVSAQSLSDLRPGLWIQTAGSSINCDYANASFRALYDFARTEQALVWYDSQFVNYWEAVSDATPFQFACNETLRLDDSTCDEPQSQSTKDQLAVGVVLAKLTDYLTGNVTVSVSPDGFGPDSLKYSQGILDSGLTACDDVSRGYWTEHALSRGPPPNSTAFADLWPNQEFWMCRNRTIERALEDLANNLTLSLLASPNWSRLVTVNGTQRLSKPIYEYDRQNLLLSYGLATGGALLISLMGLYALYQNGMDHAMGFSAILAATRNPDLDRLAEGYSPGNIAKSPSYDAKLRFGAVPSPRIGCDSGSETEASPTHAAFGLEGNVESLTRRRVRR